MVIHCRYVKYIYNQKNFNNDGEFEFIERKGMGHPDTLADALADYCLITIPIIH